MTTCTEDTLNAEIDKVLKKLPPLQSESMHDSLVGKLYLNVGPMSSGKTSHLIQKCSEFEHQEIPAIVLRSSLDTRSGTGKVASQSGAFHSCVALDNLLQNNAILSAIVNHIQVIFIDEAQFFGPELVDFCTIMTDIHKKCVYVYSLNGDSERRPFGHVHLLYALADNVQMFTGFCGTCQRGKPGVFTACKVDKKGSQLLVGHQGQEYVTQCRECYVAGELQKGSG